MGQVKVPQPPIEVTAELDAGDGAMPLVGATTGSMKITVKDTVYELVPVGDGLKIACLSDALVIAPMGKDRVMIVPVRGM